MSIFIDMDGTVARFYEHADCLDRMLEEHFFEDLRPYETMVRAINEGMKNNTLKDVYSLSAVPNPIVADRVKTEKRTWVHKHLPYIQDDHILFTVFGEQKSSVVRTLLGRKLQKSDLLLDDYTQNLLEWEAAGGTGVKILNEINGSGKRGSMWNGRAVHYQYPAALVDIQNEAIRNNRIYCIVGPSGCGKTTIAEGLQKKYGYKVVESYTTRPPRYEGETGHMFVTPDEFHALGKMCAYTQFCGYEYGVTNNLIAQSDLYVIDPAGVAFFKQEYTGDKQIVAIGITASEETRKVRMQKRGDDDAHVQQRILNDRAAFDRFEDAMDFVIHTDRLEVEDVMEAVHNIIKMGEKL